MSEQSEPDPRRHRPGDRREPRDPLHEGHARAADVRLLGAHRRRPAGPRRAVRRRRHPARPAHPPGALGPLAVADDPAALRQRRARRRLRHRHRDVRERRAGRDARRRAARGARARGAARRRRAARWASRTACRRPLGGAGTLPPCPSRRSPTRPCAGMGERSRSSTRRACPAPRCGWRSRARPTRRRPSGASRCAAPRSSGSPPPTAWPWRSRASPASARWSGAWELLRSARPTAVNLAYAVDRVRAAALAAGPADDGRGAARDEAERIHAEEDAASAAIAAHGADLLAGARRIATHCNTGALAAGGAGDGARRHPRAARARRGARARRRDAAAAAGRAPDRVGARARRRRATSSWSTARWPGLIRRGEVDAVIVGADRVAANGDTANKVGTYPLALAASAAGIPFVVAAPTSTIDRQLPDGDGIEIEERDGDEVRGVRRRRDDAPRHRRAQPRVRRHARPRSSPPSSPSAASRARPTPPRSPRCWHEGRPLAHPARRARRGGGGPRARPRRRRLPRAGLRRLRIRRPRRRGSRARCRPSSATSWRAR